MENENVTELLRNWSEYTKGLEKMKVEGER